MSLRAVLSVAPILVFALLRQLMGTEAAIIGGFAASVVALAANWRHSPAIAGLVMLTLAIVAACTAAALMLGEERVYLANEPIVDFLMAAVFLGSVAVRRPLLGPVVHELVPALRATLSDRDRAFYLATLFAVAMNAFQGGTRLTLLVTLDVRDYIIFGLAAQRACGMLMVVVSAWFILRAARARGLRAADLLRPGGARAGR